ncbi:hypothetical protein [Streptomyces sp. NPDC127084]|uniref:hypothetical protein n=1 Tax=Streptomyces sp. NPDC127084 TaxID=3347133 RepID=UPI003668A039
MPASGDLHRGSLGAFAVGAGQDRDRGRIHAHASAPAAQVAAVPGKADGGEDQLVGQVLESIGGLPSGRGVPGVRVGVGVRLGKSGASVAAGRVQHGGPPRTAGMSAPAEKCVHRHRGCLRPMPARQEEPQEKAEPTALSPWPTGHRFAERTRAEHATIHALLAAGHSKRSVARQLGMTLNTILRSSRAAIGPMKRYPDRLRVETREEFEARLKRETAKELHRRPVAA